jgi:tetratricopeptide (TPR) repeat protein
MFNVEDTLAEARKKQKEGDLACAEQICRQILAVDPNHAESHHLLGSLAYQAGRLGAAIDFIRQAVALNPQSALYYFDLGVALEASGQSDEAAKSYRSCILLKPHDARAQNALGNVLRGLGDTENAAGHFTRAIEINPEYPEAHNNLGALLCQRQKVDEGILHFLEALRLKPDYVSAKSNLGAALASKGDLDGAIRYLQEALALDPSHAQTRRNLTVALEMKARAEDPEKPAKQADRGQPQAVASPCPPLPNWIEEPPPVEPNWIYHAPQMASKFYRPRQLAYGRGKHGEDHRLKYILYFLDVRGQRVLELGPLEGHDSIILQKMGVRELVAIESRPENIAKCNLMKKRHRLDNTTFERQSLIALYEGKEEPVFTPGFDLVFCCGILYHVPNPAKALSWCRKQAPALFLATHYYEPASPESYPKDVFRRGVSSLRFEGEEYTGLLIEEETADLLSGMSQISVWLGEPDLLRMLGAAGYKNVSVLGKDLQNGRPHITILAEA